MRTLAPARPFGFVLPLLGAFLGALIAPGLRAASPTCVTLSEMTAWWRFNGDTTDTIGNNPFTLIGGATLVAGGEVSQGLALDGSSGMTRAAAAADLNIGTAPGMTIECWIRPSNAARLQDIVEWNNGNIGVHISTSTQSSRDLYVNLVDTAGVSHQIWSATGALVDNVYQHIAVSYDRTTGLSALYLNGTQIKTANLGIFTPQTSFPFYVGNRPAGVFTGIYYQGTVDELSLYRRVLGSAEIRGIYDANIAGKCAAPQPLAIVTPPQGRTVNGGENVSFSVVAQGTPPLTYAWLFNNEVLPGATQSTLSLVSVGADHIGDYAAIVSDISGSVTSNPARLNVILPILFTTHPRSTNVIAGTPVTLTSAAVGNGLLSYQWFFQGTPIAGPNGPSLTLANAQPIHAGRYHATATDGFNSATSAVAIVTVLADWSPFISEFMAQNSGPVLDEDGAPSDWIELYNPASTPTNLANWYLTDDPFDLAVWRLPSVALPPNGRVLVFASGKDRITPRLHTNFRLDGDGGYLALVQPDGVTVASEYIYPAQRVGVSYGRAGSEVYFPTPTPGAANNPGVLGYVKDTKFDTNRGVYFAPFDLVIRCATPGATILVTTNGDIPAFGSGTPYAAINATSTPQATLRIAATTVVRAAAFKDGYIATGVDTHSYILPATVVNQGRPPGASTTWIEDPPGNGASYPADFTVSTTVVNSTQPGYSFTNALVSIPTLSLVSPMEGLFGATKGIYTHPMLEGTNWEREVSLELIYPDGREGFHAGAGAQIHGDVSALPHATPKHPMRLLFRERYGLTKLQYPLFPGPVQQFDQLVLRSCSTDSWPISNDVDFLWRNQDATYQRDQWMRDTQRTMGKLSARGLYVQLYLNGVYWGLYNLTERINDSFAADHLGGSKEDYDVIQGELMNNSLHVASAGTDATWLQMLQTVNQVPANPSKYWEIQGLNPDGTRDPELPVLLDVDNLIDYMALHIYAAAVDWPNRNWWALRKRDTSPTQRDSTGFKFLAWDQEIAIDRLDRTITWYNNSAFESVNQADSPAQVYDRLRGHPEFKLRFADHLQKYLFNGGLLTVASNQARWAARAAEIDHAIVGESARWGDVRKNPPFNRATDWLRLSNFTQNIYFPSNETLALRRFRNVGLIPNFSAPSFSQWGGAVPANFLLTMSHSNGTGTIRYTMDGTDPRRPGGAVAVGAQTYSAPVAIASPTLVRARVLSGSTWSALVEAQYFPPQDLSRLQLSEIMYNPPRSGLIDGEEFEFLELKNSGPDALDLSGLRFTAGINFTFANDTWLNPGEYFVLARNAAEFAARYQAGPPDGIYTGKLDNNGEALALSTSLGATIFAVTYNNAAPWPAEADNSGLSMQRISFASSPTNTASWLAAPPTPGSGPASEWNDADGDGLPDGWEQAYGFSPGNNEAGDDPDGDGLTNLEEFRAGTNPLLASDALRLRALSTTRLGADGMVELGFEARSNKTYTVIFRDGSGAGWQSLANVGVAATNRFVTVQDAVPRGTATRFYKLTTPKLP